jgi:lysophospholipase L1-like esterase
MGAVGRPWIVRTALLVCSLLMSLAAAEILVRAMLPPPASVAVSDRPGTAHRSTGGSSLILATAEGRRMRPDAVAVIRNHRISGRDVVIRTNSLGLRGPEPESRRCATTILFVGDSVTAQDYLPLGETFVATVGELARSRGHAWCAVNAAVSGTGIDNHLRMLDHFGPRIHPDLVVVGLYLNDFRESLFLLPSPPPPWLRWSWLACTVTDALRRERLQASFDQHLGAYRDELEERRREIRTRFATLEPGLGDDRRVEELITSTVHDWGGAWTQQAWEILTPALAAARERGRVLGAQVIVAAFPVRHQVEANTVFDYPQRRLGTLCQELEIPYLDLLPILRTEVGRQGSELYYDHCHPTAGASPVIAGAIYDFLATVAPVEAP